MRTHYHEFESLEHLLATRLLPGGSATPIRMVVFGGTGAVGGGAVLALCRLILQSRRFRHHSLRGEIHATGMSDKEITGFVRRLYLTLDGEEPIEKVEPRRHYRIADCIDLYFSHLHLRLPHDLEAHVEATRAEAGDDFDLEKVLDRYWDQQPRPILSFVEAMQERLGGDLLHAVLVAIPLPSVATYTTGLLDRLVDRIGLDHQAGKRIKSGYLRGFLRGLAVVQQRYARRVVIAHTTAVGGMYRVDGGSEEIRLGFAHSALGKKLHDKKYFADKLTQLYLDQGFAALITAAAIGIDSVDFHCRLPLDRNIATGLRATVEALPEDIEPPIPVSDLGDHPSILLYPSMHALLDPLPESGPNDSTDDEPAADDDEPSTDDATGETGETETAAPGSAGEATTEPTPAETSFAAHAEPPPDPTGPLHFGAGKDLIVDAAVRSGENGLFSVANCVALYNVMKVAIPEELASIVVRYAIFGPERRRDWFQNKVCYYGGTENAHFAQRLLDNYPALQRAHLGAFAIQAYQALGSSTHQARLHELGLINLLLRLLDLGRRFADIPEATLTAAVSALDDFFWEHTRAPAFEDFEQLDVESLGTMLGQLCATESKEDVGHLIGYEVRLHGLREPGREKFLARVATAIRRYLATITSLGIPILYRDPRDGQDRLLVGPHVAPLELAVTRGDSVITAIQTIAREHDLPYDIARDWVIANNGFVDLRPHALASAATDADRHLERKIARFDDPDALLAWIDDLPVGGYFTTCGLVATQLRLSRLYDCVRRRKIQLGTSETWKHLFLVDNEDRHILTPGLIETMRMYAEGLGKVTGTEGLWPDWGY